MADVEQKLSNVEHQLETAKVEVTKPFAQEQELVEKLERLAELNALLNMDEKGDNVLDMGDDEPEDETGEQSAQAQEGEQDRAEDIQAVADEPLKPVASSLMSERIAEHDKLQCFSIFKLNIHLFLNLFCKISKHNVNYTLYFFFS